MDTVFSLLVGTLTSCVSAPPGQDPALAEMCLNTLACYLEWAAVQHVMGDALLLLLLQLLNREGLQQLAAECLVVVSCWRELLGWGRDGEEGWIWVFRVSLRMLYVYLTIPRYSSSPLYEMATYIMKMLPFSFVVFPLIVYRVMSVSCPLDCNFRFFVVLSHTLDVRPSFHSCSAATAVPMTVRRCW